MKTKKRYGIYAFILSILVAFAFILPIVWMLSSSLKDNNTMFELPPRLIPHPAVWRNYLDAVHYIPFFTYLKNTLLVSIISSLGIILSTPSVAYAFAKMQWPGRNAVFILVLSTLMLPFQVQMIPLYVLFKNMGWVGTLLPLIVPNFFSNALFIFLMRQFMIGIPNELSEAAIIDGAGHFAILTRVIVPLCKPAIFAVALFTFLGNWTDFLGPLIFLNKQETMTLSLGLQQYSSVHRTQWAYLMAACTLFTTPVLIVFFLAQRSFIEGITFTGIKG